MPEHAVAIHARNLGVTRGKKHVLHDLSFDVPGGQITGLLGPSGGGKSTLMRAIVGVQAKVTGTLEVLGEPAGTRDLRTRVAYATQAASVYDDLTVTQNLRYFASILGAPSANIARVIDQVGLSAQKDQRVTSLSGGQRGRVSLGIALLGAPELLVLDEPTVGLDPILRNELWDLFHEFASNGTTILVSSHVMDEASRCDRLLMLREGQVIADATLPEILKRTGATDAEGAFLALERERRNDPDAITEHRVALERAARESSGRHPAPGRSIRDDNTPGLGGYDYGGSL